jgi:hypothetical protein
LKNFLLMSFLAERKVEMGNVVVVQQIHTRWSKACRGGENAGKRNAVPEIARIPVQHITEANLTLVHHLLGYGERNGFSKPYEEVRINSSVRPLTVGCVSIDYSEEQALVTFRYNRVCGGAPDRSWARKLLSMAVNEWSQTVYNGRFAPDWGGDWWYEKMVVNVGLFEHIKPGVFTRQEPTCQFNAIGELF